MRKLMLGTALAALFLARSLTPANAGMPIAPGLADAAKAVEPVAYVCRWSPWRGQVCWWRPGYYGYGAFGYYRPSWGRPWGWRRHWY